VGVRYVIVNALETFARGPIVTPLAPDIIRRVPLHGFAICPPLVLKFASILALDVEAVLGRLIALSRSHVMARVGTQLHTPQEVLLCEMPPPELQKLIVRRRSFRVEEREDSKQHNA